MNALPALEYSACCATVEVVIVTRALHNKTTTKPTNNKQARCVAWLAGPWPWPLPLSVSVVRCGSPVLPSPARRGAPVHSGGRRRRRRPLRPHRVANTRPRTASSPGLRCGRDDALSPLMADGSPLVNPMSCRMDGMTGTSVARQVVCARRAQGPRWGAMQAACFSH